MDDCGVLVGDGTHLFKIADRWKGDQEEVAKVLVEDVKTGRFKWLDATTVEKMEVIYPSSE